MDRERKGEPPRRPAYAGLDDAFASASGGVLRPLCLCVPGGVPMYVARHGGTRLVKRMPLSGFRHAPGCPHFGRCEPAVAGAPASGSSDQQPELVIPEGSLVRAAQTVTSDGPVAVLEAPRLSLLALLHELWIRAELTKWHPGFAGKRHWGIVRRHLLQAARQIRTPTGALARRIYVPEVFNVERADAIRERREARWDWILSDDGGAQPSMVVVGELKALRRGPRVARAWLKHLPDLPLALRERELGRIEQRFAGPLAMRGAHDELHTVCIATVLLDLTGAATVVELELMVCSAEWIPLADEDERALVARLVEERRRFTKHLAAELSPRDVMTVAFLRETPGPTELLIDRSKVDQASSTSMAPDGRHRFWVWRPAVEPIPPLPGSQAATGPPSGDPDQVNQARHRRVEESAR